MTMNTNIYTTYLVLKVWLSDHDATPATGDRVATARANKEWSCEADIRHRNQFETVLHLVDADVVVCNRNQLLAQG